MLKTALLRPTSWARAARLRVRHARPFAPARHLPVLLVLLLAPVAACGRSPAPAPRGSSPRLRVDAATSATITGRVAFTGTVPKFPAVAMSSDAYCVHTNPGDPPDDSLIVGQAGALQNVFVYVKDDLAAYAFDTPAQPVRLDQKGCRFTPHVVGLQAGQTLEIANQDDTLHNVHAITKVNDDFNIGAVRGAVTRRTFTAPETMIAFRCDVHGWMTAYAGVLPHPYFAVTGPDGGFALKGLPPGDYTIAAWHEKFGTHTRHVSVGAKETKEIDFTFQWDVGNSASGRPQGAAPTRY